MQEIIVKECLLDKLPKEMKQNKNCPLSEKIYHYLLSKEDYRKIRREQ